MTTNLASSDGLLKLLPKVICKTGWPWIEETDPGSYATNITWPKLTIVTPSYNQGNFLEQTIRSVLLQNYPNLEYIIIDGGSTDNTTEILEKYSPWISYWQSEKDSGQGHAINLGFSIASGDYYAWINSDDYYLPNTFYNVVNCFVKTNPRFIYGYAYNYYTEESRYELVKQIPLLDYFLRIPVLAQPSCFWKKSIHQPIWEELSCSIDYELWLRIIKGNSRKLLRQPLSVANIHKAAKTSDANMGKAWQKDHLLICGEEGHGEVKEWNKIIFLKRLYTSINRLLSI
ncbi:glycosyltransferase family 2 protein [Pedobacter aquatilis]|uniref:glycosyltransferase family 2 protein n=1 Tax=Pedobacter aquatilis TaxID=351343 RepID=UPI0029302A0C|nr:glycosyltransferase family 2 protein [Pedobacter aquatilis]